MHSPFQHLNNFLNHNAEEVFSNKNESQKLVINNTQLALKLNKIISQSTKKTTL